MDAKEFDEYITGVANQIKVSYSKTGWLDAEDEKKFDKVLMEELNLSFKHLLVTE